MRFDEEHAEPGPSGATTPAWTRIDRAFVRYCEHGDVDALAEVFDRAAPRLAVLAAHLVPGDRQLVEDLVQTTFLEAIRAAARFDTTRPVLPWLVTILSNRAANARRSASRQRSALGPSVGEPVEDPAASDAIDPRRVAEEREVAEQVATAIDRIGGASREVLQLRLVHGLTPIEIARVLGRPAGTVHAQLTRGLDKLRQALPKAIAPVSAGALFGLDSVRAAVLREAASQTGQFLSAASSVVVRVPLQPSAWVAWISWTASWWTMKKLTVGGVALLALVAWWSLSLGGGTQPRAVASTTPVGLTVALDTAPTTELAEESAATAARSVVRASGPAADTVRFTGRVVRADDGLPIAGATVTATQRRQWWSREDDALPDPVVAATDSDGVFVVDAVPHEAAVLGLEVDHPGRVPMRGSFRDLRLGQTIEHGDVPMLPGVGLAIRALDDEGWPVGGFGVQLRGPSVSVSSDDGELTSARWSGSYRFADENGLIGPEVVVAGDYIVEHCSRVGLDVEAPELLSLATGVGSATFDITLRRPELETSIRGRVVDETGAPVVGVQVRAHRATNAPARVGLSYADGRFAIPLPANAAVERVSVRAEQESFGALEDLYEVLTPRGVVRAGDEVTVVVRPARTRAGILRAVDPSGAPVALRAVRVARRLMRSAWQLDGELYATATNESRPAPGVVRWERLPGLPLAVVLLPTDPRLQQAVLVEVPAMTATDDEDLALDVVVDWREELRVRVVDPRGEPVGGARVEFLRPLHGDLDGTPHWPRTLDEIVRPGLNGTSPEVLTAESVSDEDGLATLLVAPGRAGCSLRVSGPGVLTSSHPDAAAWAGRVDEFWALDADGALVVRVERSVRLVGRLGPLEIVHAFGPTETERARAGRLLDPEDRLQHDRIELELKTTGSHRNPGWQRLEAVVDDDGRFVFEGVALAATGAVGEPRELVLTADLLGRAVELARIPQPTGGGDLDLTLDLSDCAPATIRGRVLLDGVLPPPGSSLQHSDWRSASLDPASGRFEAVVPAGVYRPELTVSRRYGSQSRSYECPEGTMIEVRAGETGEVTLDFRSDR